MSAKNIFNKKTFASFVVGAVFALAMLLLCTACSGGGGGAGVGFYKGGVVSLLEMSGTDWMYTDAGDNLHRLCMRKDSIGAYVTYRYKAKGSDTWVTVYKDGKQVQGTYYYDQFTRELDLALPQLHYEIDANYIYSEDFKETIIVADDNTFKLTNPRDKEKPYIFEIQMDTIQNPR